MIPATNIRRYNWRAYAGTLRQCACALLVCAVLPFDTAAMAQEGASPTPLKRPATRKLKGPQPLVAFPGGLVWQTQLSAAPDVAPAFDGTFAYAALKDGSLTAIDLETGETRWTVSQVSTVGPAVGGDLIVGAAGSTVWARDRATGAPRWQHEAGADVVAAPLVVGTNATVALSSDELLGLSTEDGSAAWRLALGAKATTPLAGFANLALAGLADGRVVAAEVTSGRQTWARPLTGPLVTLSVVESRVFAGATDNFLYVLDGRSGNLRWQWRTGGDPVGAVTSDTVGLYHVSLDNTLRAHSRRSGDLAWKANVPSRPAGGPLSVGDRVVVGGVAKELRAFASRDGRDAGVVGLPGRLLYRPYLLPETETTPGRLIVVVGGGIIVAIGETLEPPLVPMNELPGKPLRAEVASRIAVGS